MRDLDAPPEQILAAWLATLLTPAAPHDLVELPAEMMRNSHAAGVRVALNALGPADLRPVLDTIVVPTLLLYGGADQRSPVSVGQDLQARIPGSTLVVLPGAPHLANLEQPHAFNQAVRVFARHAAQL